LLKYSLQYYFKKNLTQSLSALSSKKNLSDLQHGYLHRKEHNLLGPVQFNFIG
jgi:hypothetical protein